jgi:chromosome segregation ATPase
MRASVSWFDTPTDEDRALDQELIAYLDERFRETSRQIESLREATSQEFEVSRQETMQQISALRGETTQQIGGLAQRFDRLEEKVRHNGVEIEALRGEIRQVGEGVAGANQSLGTFRQDVAAEFKDVRASIRVPFENLNKRVLVLEAKVKVLDKNLQKGKSQSPS